MKRSIPFVFLLLLGGCAKQSPPPHLSTDQHLSEAMRCEVGAREHESMMRHESEADIGVVCTDRGLDAVSTTGNEPVSMQRPCWSALLDDNERHRSAAQRLLAKAKEHRKAAAILVDAELQACQGLGELEISASPFYYFQDVLKVEELKQSGKLRGAQVLFRKVPGLSVEAMRKSIACHQARAAAVGYASDFQAYDPLSLPSVAASVTEDDAGIWVRLRSEQHATALAVLGRAQDCSR